MIPGGPSKPEMGGVLSQQRSECVNEVRSVSDSGRFRLQLPDPHSRKGAPDSLLTRGGLNRDELIGAHVRRGYVGITATALDP